jgi:type VI secretion system protein ImpL
VLKTLPIKKPWPVPLAIFPLFVLLAWWVASLLGLQGTELWVVRIAISALGAIASLLVYLLLARRQRAAAAAAGGTPSRDDIDLAVAAAEKRLASAGAAGKKSLRQMPVLLVLGPAGSAKTTVLHHSGLEPEHLAGEIDKQGEVFAPTEGANLWISGDSVIVEAGGAVLQDAARWSRLVRHLRPARWKAAFLGRPQAPRAAVVCFSCEEFLKPGNSEAVPAAARVLRERVAEASEQLGIRLPVYVVFTKTDRIPYFADFVRSLSREEAQEVLGATMPAVLGGDVGSYPERQSARVREAFGGIFHSLALKRLEIIPRDVQEEVRGGAYEFPREFRKVSELATQFLVELCKPRQLGMSPFLRGFYFSGVRPVMVSDVATERAPAAPHAGQIALGATSVFNPNALKAAAASASPVQGSRKVPEWVFVRRFFRDVLLKDRVAMAITSGGARVDVLRRAALGSAAALCLLLAAALTISFLNNRRLQTDTLAAARAVEGIGVTGSALAPIESLQRLDELRSQMAVLRDYEEAGRPRRLGWGLYTGSALLPEARRLYFDRFERVLWGRTRAQVLASLRGLPQAPTESSDYGGAYDVLKAHLVTTTHPQESSREFLTPVLLAQWTAADDPGGERTELAARQFDLFASELRYGKPFPDESEEATVARTRLYLRQFAGIEQFYQVMISEASSGIPAVQFSRQFPGAAPVVRNSYVVPGAFTRDGWTLIQTNLDNVDRLFAREDWVVGDRALSAEERVRLAQELRARYTADYVRHWREYLAAGSVSRIGGLGEAPAVLARLSANESPLLQMLALASRNTGVDSTTIARAFQPVHQVMPPSVTDRYIDEGNAGYISALAGLQGSLEQVAAAAGPGRTGAMMQAMSSADQVRSAVRTISQTFSLEGDARAVGSSVQSLLQAPLLGMDTMLGGLPAGEINQLGASFCAPFRAVTAKYPFTPRATTEASIDELAALFQPGSSALWTFYEDALQDVLVRQGPRFAPRVGATPQPTPQFVTFFNRAAELSQALYGGSGSSPEVSFLLRAQTTDDLPEITINIDGVPQTFTRTFAAARTFTWVGAQARQARLSAQIGGVETTLLETRGPWAVFHLLQAADWEPQGTGRYTLRWRIPGREQIVTAELNMPPGTPPIFSRDYMSQLTCVPQIVR